MTKLDPYELEVLEAYGSGKLKAITSKAEMVSYTPRISPCCLPQTCVL